MKSWAAVICPTRATLPEGSTIVPGSAVVSPGARLGQTARCTGASLPPPMTGTWEGAGAWANTDVIPAQAESVTTRERREAGIKRDYLLCRVVSGQSSVRKGKAGRFAPL